MARPNKGMQPTPATRRLARLMPVGWAKRRIFMNRFIFLISLVFLGFHPPVLIASENAAARPAVKPAPVLSIEERKELSQLCYKAGLDAHLSGDQERAMKYWWLMSKLDPDWLERKSLDTKEGREQFLKHSQKIGGESSPQ